MFGVTPYNPHNVRRKDRTDAWSNLIDDFFRDDFFPMRDLKFDTFKVDIIDDHDKYLIEADMPGVDKKDIHLDYHDGLLDISIKVEDSKSEEKPNYIYRERKQSSAHRTLNLGELNYEKIEASLKDGILKITAPKAQQIEEKRKIEIK